MFRFRLQPVLEMRERHERDKKLALSELERERLEIEQRIRGYQCNIEAEQASLAGMLTGTDGVDLRGARLQANSALHNRFLAQRLVLDLAGLYRKIERARAELTEASTKRKAVELLRDRQREAYEMEQRRRESIELDDLSVMRHSRREPV